MPRCGCADSCSCLVVAGDGISVEGIGTLERPYEITSESADLVGRAEFTDDGNVDFTTTGVGTLNDPLTVFADAHPSVQELSDTPDETPANGDVIVWQTDHWEYQQQSGGGGTGLPPGGTDGQVLTKQSSVDGDALWETITGGGGGAVAEPTYYSCRGHATATSLANNVQTNIPFDTLVADDGIPWNGTQWVIPVDGYYDVEAMVTYTGTATAGARYAFIVLNGNAVQASSVAPTTGASQVSASAALTIKCKAGDLVEIKGQQTNGTALTVNGNPVYNRASITKVPAPAPPGGGGVVVDRPAASRRKHAAATGIAPSTVTAIAWDTEDYTDGIPWSASDVAFIAPSDGYYDVEACVTFASNTTGGRFLYAYVEGVNQGVAATNTNGGAVGQIATTVKALAGQKINVRVQQTAGVSLALNGNLAYNWISVTKVPQAFSGSAVSTYGERIYSASRGHSAATSIPNGTHTPIPFNTEMWNDGIPFTTDSFTVPVAGYYQVDAAGTLANNATGIRSLSVMLNSTYVETVQYGPASGASTGMSVSATVKAAAGDLISVRIYQNSGAALVMAGGVNNNYVAITKVPAPVINGAAASGVWGTAPLNKFGTTLDTEGQPVYIDSKAQLRTQPLVITDGSRLASALIETYPVGVSVMNVSSAQAAANGWPSTAGGTVQTVRQSPDVAPGFGFQIYSRNNAASTMGISIRQASSDGWSEWAVLVGTGKAYREAAGVSTLSASLVPNTGVSLAISYPVGRFTVPPIVVGSADSNGYGFGGAAGSSVNGCTLRYYNPTASTHSTCKVHWHAVQMTPTTAEG